MTRLRWREEGPELTQSLVPGYMSRTDRLDRRGDHHRRSADHSSQRLRAGWESLVWADLQPP